MISSRISLHTATLMVCAFLLLTDICEALQNDGQAKNNKPNIIIILADDMVISTNEVEIRDPPELFGPVLIVFEPEK